MNLPLPTTPIQILFTILTITSLQFLIITQASKWLACLQHKRSKNNLIFELLNLNPNNKEKNKLNNKAVLKAIQQNPQAASIQYDFSYDDNDDDDWNEIYPLHQAIKLHAEFNTIQALYNSYPEAINEKSRYNFNLALLCSIQFHTSVEILSFLLSKCCCCLKELERVDAFGYTLLHYACQNDASHSIICTLLHYYPEAAIQHNKYGELPLHLALSPAKQTLPKVDTISLLLQYHPDGIKEANRYNGWTPLHIAANHTSTTTAASDNYNNVMLLLLNKWSRGILAKDKRGRTPFDLYQKQKTQRIKEGIKEDNSNVHDLLSNVYKLYTCTYLDETDAKEMLHYFLSKNVRDCILMLLLHHYPDFVVKEELGLDLKVLPVLLSIMGQQGREYGCALKTMWRVIGCELDVLEGV